MKRILTGLLALCLTVTLAAPAFALEYEFDGAEGTEYGDPTSQEPVLTPDGGEQENEDVSKNAALIPPPFGSASAEALNTGDYLTPNLAPGGQPGVGSTISGYESAQYPPAAGAVTGSGDVLYSPGTGAAYGSGSSTVTWSGGDTSGTGFTAVTDNLYYPDGSLGTLTIPSIGVNTKIYEGTGTASMAKGAAHFEDTSIWDGNVCLCGHNRGTNEIFGKIHTLELGDTITLTTMLGTRTYRVVSVSKIAETDWSGVSSSSTNMISLYTCVMNEREYRWCVQAVEVV